MRKKHLTILTLLLMVFSAGGVLLFPQLKSGGENKTARPQQEGHAACVRTAGTVLCLLCRFGLRNRTGPDSLRSHLALFDRLEDRGADRLLPGEVGVALAEGESHILTLTVQQSGLPLKDNRPLITYSVLDGQILKTTVPSRAVCQMGLKPGYGVLELGDHPIADELRGLDVSTTAVVTKNYLTRYGILPAGEPIGPADRPHPGHVGEDREFGRLTVSYDEGEIVDLYAERAKRKK